MADQEKIINALAEEFDIDPENVLNYAVIVKHKTDDGSTLSSVWPMPQGAEELLGLISVLNVHAERSVA